MTITREQIDEMEQKARVATPGPWSTDVFLIVADIPGGRPGGEVIIWCTPSVPRLLTRKQEVANAGHVAAADPTAVLALIAWVRELEAIASTPILLPNNRVVCPSCKRRWFTWQTEQHEPDCIVLTLPKVSDDG